MSEPRPYVSGRLVLGLAIVLLGVLFTLDNLDLVESEPFLAWWPVVIIAVGLSKLTGVGRADRPGGVVLTILGGVLLWSSLDLLSFSIWRLWPVGLIALGLSVVWRSWRTRVGSEDPDPAEVADASRMSIVAIWSGISRRSVSPAFRLAEVTAIMGGAEIDLRGARAAQGPAVVDMMVLMGGLEIRVDETWRVVVEGTAVMGAIEDSTRGLPDAPNTLIVRGTVLMGGVEIKS